VMDLVHVGRDDEQPKPAIPAADGDVGVVELDNGNDQCVVHHQIPNLEPEERDEAQPQH
jgi:hypothetical protein